MEQQRDVEGIASPSNVDAGKDDNNDIVIVLLDLATSGLGNDCDILQIATKCDDSSFDRYVTPVHDITVSATRVNGLRIRDGNLTYHGRIVPTVPISVALKQLHEWLTSIGKKCCIAAHNISYHGHRFMRDVVRYSLQTEFSEVIYGFVDTIQIIRTRTNRREIGSYSLTNLATVFRIPIDEAENAARGCEILYQILEHLTITPQDLLTNSKTFADQIRIWNL